LRFHVIGPLMTAAAEPSAFRAPSPACRSVRVTRARGLPRPSRGGSLAIAAACIAPIPLTAAAQPFQQEPSSSVIVGAGLQDEGLCRRAMNNATDRPAIARYMHRQRQHRHHHNHRRRNRRLRARNHDGRRRLGLLRDPRNGRPVQLGRRNSQRNDECLHEPVRTTGGMRVDRHARRKLARQVT
jgi:hypothetical protein